MARVLQKFSFRQLLVIAFLLIAALLGAASLRGLHALEALTRESRDSVAKALALNEAAQSLSERSLAMERSARQSVILDDRVLGQRFADSAKNAVDILGRLRAQGIAAKTTQQWLQQLNAMTPLLKGSLESASDRERQLVQSFRALDAINASIAMQAQAAILQRNTTLASRLEASLQQLAQQVMAAIGLAVVMAIGFGIWFTRPLKRLENAIVGLGENRLDDVIDIPGPADLALIGQRLNWLRLRLVELDADKARFLRHISHELKTPLASLREGVSLLEDGVAGALSHDQREIAQILQHNTSLLQRQIEDLLHFNTAAFEARQLHRAPTDLLGLVHAQIEAQQLQWRALGLNVNVTGSAGLVVLDAEKIGTAVANLLSNAIRYSPPNATITFALRADSGWAYLDVQDQGPGVANADLERIFEPFYRGERQPHPTHGLNVRRQEGSGIGLSIVHEYVAAHGGRIAYVAPLAEQPGAHFRLELPHAL
jgi:two-component system sensor histidine kinase GlrK